MMGDIQQFIAYYQQHEFVFLILVLWSLVWKGIALWKAGRNNDPVWFIVMLVVNLLGVLEILYIFIFSKKRIQDKTVETPTNHE